jgi:hypothetical protein
MYRRILIAAAVTIVGAGWTNAQDRGSPRVELRGTVKSVDPVASTITIAIGAGREGVAERTLALARDVEVAVGSGRAGIGVFREGKLSDLAAGLGVGLTLAADQKTVDSVLVEPPVVRGELKGVDVQKKTLTLGAPFSRERAGDDKTYTVAPGAEILVDDGRGRRQSLREATLGELASGAVINAQLSLDRKQIQSVIAEGPSLFGPIKAVDAGKKTVTLVVRPPRGDDAGEERTLPVAPDAPIVLDDGKGRRLSLREAKLDDVPVGGFAGVRLSLDQAAVVSLRAEGARVSGFLKGVDANKGVIVIAIPRGRDEAEEKTFAVAKDARVTIDNQAMPLANLRPDGNGPLVQLRLTLDQQSVQFIAAQQLQQRQR